MDSGRFEESLREATLAADLDPLNLPVTNHLAAHYYLARQYDKMLDVAQHTLDLDPTFMWGWMQRGMAHAMKGMYDQAVQDTEKAAALEGRTDYILSQLGLIYAMTGKRSDALAIQNTLEREFQDYQVARIYVVLGDRERAFAWLEKAIAARDDGVLWIKVDPLLDPLRSDPRFPGLVRRVGLAP
jgi:tetratricopeptide (TPR) repeat protein